MKTTTITYRGASMPIAELEIRHQLEQRQATRLVRYRGATAETVLHQPKVRKMHHVTYRGVEADMEF